MRLGPSTWPADWPSPDALHRMAREIVRGDEGVEHVLGHAVVQALTNPPRHHANVHGWFRSTMVNASIDWLRRTRVRPVSAAAMEIEADPEERFDADAVVDELDRAELRELIELLRTELGRLEARERRVVELIYYQGLTTTETANRLEISASTVERSKRQAIEAMRRQVGDEPRKYGRSVLAMAGAPARLWSKGGAPAAGAGTSVAAAPVGFLSVLLLVVVSFTTYAALSAIGSGQEVDASKLVEVPLPEEGDIEPSEQEPASPLELVPPEAGVREAVVEPGPSGLTAPDPAPPAPTGGRHLFEVRLAENGQPLAGLRQRAWLVGPGGLPEIASADAAPVEEVEPGLYRFDLAVEPRPWNLSLTDGERGLSIWLERQLPEGESSEAIDLPLTGRSFAIPFGQGENYGHPSLSPWGRIKGISSLGPATWLFCTPRPHGGIHDGTSFERPFDGFLHFDAAQDHGFTLSYWAPDVDPLAYEPVEGVQEVTFVPESQD